MLYLQDGVSEDGNLPYGRTLQRERERERERERVFTIKAMMYPAFFYCTNYYLL